MRIGVDMHVLSGKFQGSRTYLLNLYQHVLKKQQQKDEFYFFGHWNDDQPYGNEVRYVDFKSDSKIKRLTYETHPLLLENKINLYHTTYITPIRVPCETVVTIHDILFETHPQFFTKQEVWRNKLLVRRSAKRAKQIHTVSQFSKQALIELYDVPEHKIHIVPNGVDLTKFSPGNKAKAKEDILNKYGIEEYILTVGRIEPRKNHLSLLKAYNILKERNVKLGKLVIVGKPDFHFKQFLEAIDDLKLQDDVKIIDSVDDQTLPDIYRAAKLFVYPSFAEGFGIPPLEAMACGVPVISSNTTAIPEVIGDAGILINPNDIEQLAAAINEILSNPDMIKVFSEKGEEQSKKWSWDHASQLFINATQNL
jgi:glycosyltransferase involved in cell wall biosynthesis